MMMSSPLKDRNVHSSYFREHYQSIILQKLLHDYTQFGVLFFMSRIALYIYDDYVTTLA